MSKKKKETSEEYIVQSPFRDVNDFSISYEAGDDVSHLEQERLDELISKGLVKGPGEEE